MTLRVTKQLTIFNEQHLADRLALPHTICATGNPRGGTSSVALFLRETGLFMGDDLIAFNHEDRRLQRAWRDAARFAEVARDYDARHDVWGFKLPIGSHMGRRLIPDLRNPIQLIVGRSAISITRSRFARRKLDGEALFWETLEQLNREWIAILEFARAGDHPVILIEYERLLADPRAFGTDLVEALRLDVTEETLERAVSAIAQPGYHRFSGDLNPRPLRMERRAVARRLHR